MNADVRRYNVVYSADALDDIGIIYDYISKKLYARQPARRIVKRIREQIKSLNMFPERHPLAPEKRLAEIGLRKVSVENFVIYYEVNEKSLTVTIARIMFGGRDAENIIH
ncbi:MAG: type II toxin-antitoxin system RelE/ParE family toxin [Oscillospiraceae bacterium]|nr:type II toxin-antitoxin system RelE/ParE family toxin [Oscillospiraceae bacterium]